MVEKVALETLDYIHLSFFSFLSFYIVFWDEIWYLLKKIGSVPEWLKGADCKSAGYAYVGSNPTRPI